MLGTGLSMYTCTADAERNYTICIVHVGQATSHYCKRTSADVTMMVMAIIISLNGVMISYIHMYTNTRMNDHIEERSD